MKATKIMGAVLGVLLVAALFTGAAAAAGTATNPLAPSQTVFVYQANTGLADGYYNLLNDFGTATGTAVSVKNGAITGMNLIEGLYSNGTYTFALKYPAIELNAVVKISDKDDEKADAEYDLADSSVVKDYAKVEISVEATNAAGIANTNMKLLLIDPSMTKEVKDFDGNGKLTINVDDTMKKGTWYVQPYFKGGLVASAPEDIVYGDLVPFNIIESDDESLTASVNTFVVGDIFQLTVHGVPGVTYFFTNQSLYVKPMQNQKDVTYPADEKTVEFKMPASGVFDISFKAIKDGDDITLPLGGKTASSDVEITISIEKGSIVADAVKDSYIIGQDIKLVGTSTVEDDNLYFYIEGSNIPFRALLGENGNFLTAKGGEWDKKITAKILAYNKLNLDAGTYTFYVSTVEPKVFAKAADLKDYVTDGTYDTAAVALKQPFIRFTKAPDVVAQGEKLTVEGIADAADSVIWYIFGTNYFQTGVVNVKDDDSFKITIEKEYTKKEHMDAGQYFLVVQHPMYDGLYSIAAENMTGWTAGSSSIGKTNVDQILESTQKGIYKYKDGALVQTDAGKALFATGVRQTPNAAQALCDALDSQNFDDLYTKASFIVAAPTSTINPLPSQITKGQVLTVSGTTNGYVGEIVSVEFLSTAFAAVPKEVVGSASFISLTTKVADDGTWSVTFDTSSLNADDYTCSVAVADLGKTISQIKIVEGSTPVTPTQTTGPVTPTAQPTAQPSQTPATPGFGALAALAGLGAVAVLLLRRE